MIVLHPEADLRGLHAPGTQGASDFLTDRGGSLRAVWAANRGTLSPTALTSEATSQGGPSQKTWPLTTSSTFLPPDPNTTQGSNPTQSPYRGIYLFMMEPVSTEGLGS